MISPLLGNSLQVYLRLQMEVDRLRRYIFPRPAKGSDEVDGFTLAPEEIDALVAAATLIHGVVSGARRDAGCADDNL